MKSLPVPCPSPTCGIACLWMLAVMLGMPAQAAPLSPFVAVGGGVFDGPGNEIVPEVLQSSVTGPLLLETGSLPVAYGRFRADFGSNGFEIQTTGGVDREVDGGSIWTDGFAITGSTGFLTVSSRIQGTVSGDVDMGYGLFVSPQPFDLATMVSSITAASGFWDIQLPAANRVLFTGVANRCGQLGASNDCGRVPFENLEGPLDVTLATSIPVTDGQTLYFASLFAGGVGVFGGSQSFFNSAEFGITAPAGVTLASLSGTAYASAVPLPGTAWLMLTGLVGLAARWARRPVAGGPDHC